MIQQKVVELSKEDVLRILSLEEDWTMDKKGKDITPRKLSHSVSAFANTNGGELYIGMSHYLDQKNTYFWDGFSTKEEYNQIVDVITSVCPGYDDCSFEYCYGEECASVILHVTIQKTRRVIKATNSTPYLRIGVQNIPQTTQEQLRQLEYDKGIFSYEDEFTACSFDDIKDSPVLIGFIREVVPRTNAYDWLKSQYLMNNSLKINVAGVLLYSESPQAIIPKRSAIRILRYHSDMKEGSRKALDIGYPISIEGDIYTLISEAVKKTKQIVEETNVVGLSGMESKKYPDVTLHEIITNAVLHRDYSIAADIQIRIFTDRLEIESPGKLPGHITIENILREQLSRNAKIVRLISKFPYPPNKDAGEGLNTAFDAMASMDLKKPVIKEKDNSVIVIIKHERLADHEVTIFDYLKMHSSINNAEGRKLTGITDTIKMKDVFTRLRAQGSIELVPGKKGNASRWQLTNKSKNSIGIKEKLFDKQGNYSQIKMEDFK